MIKVDIVVAVRNEIASIPIFIQKVRALTLPQGVEIGFIFIEDSSTDGTPELLKKLSSVDKGIVFYSLKYGYGQCPAVAYGLKKSKADAMIMMDVDGGHSIEIIPSLIARYVAGCHVVQAIRKTPDKRALYRRLGTFVFNSVMGVLTGVQLSKQNVFFRLVSKDVSKKLLKDKRWPFYLRIRYSENKKWNVEYVEFYFGERRFGVSKYNFERLLKFSVLAYFSSVSVLRFLLLIAEIFIVAISSFLNSLYPLCFFFVTLIVTLTLSFWWVSRQAPLKEIELKQLA